MKNVITAAVTVAIALAVTAAPAAASAPTAAPHRTTVQPVEVLRAPVSEFCQRSQLGHFALLAGRGWPVVLKCVSDNGRDVWSRQIPADGGQDMPLPGWFHWDGSTSSRCITAWGQRADSPGNTSARICADGSAHLS